MVPVIGSSTCNICTNLRICHGVPATSCNILWERTPGRINIIDETYHTGEFSGVGGGLLTIRR